MIRIWVYKTVSRKIDFAELVLRTSDRYHIISGMTCRTSEATIEPLTDITEKKPHVSTWHVDSGCSRHMTGTLELLPISIKKEALWLLEHNLISVSQLCDNGMDVMFKIKYCIMYKVDTLIEVMRSNRRGDLYLLCFETLEAKEEICLVSSVKNEEAWLWHTRFCHLTFVCP
ncbi:hypothetical protein OSB04_024144 [Centaurea solstitialis]|uniref:GAG-pre-integrase domain-containing protein n=1 Tax=Centaurea solstitialis TaxID=347529 RepID=A0AA38T409_9ASTR|nr:hypothetical protein OSB04_024144 [Centaurea solstitialis]